MTALTVFNFQDANVRTVTLNGELHFVAKDLATILGYRWNGTKTIAHVPAKWWGVESVSTPSGDQKMHVLSEQGMYFFLGRSDKPLALPLQEFVAGEVLPAIRKTGSFSVTPRDPLSDIDKIAQAVASGMGVIRQDIDAITGRLDALNPQAIAIEAADIETSRRKRLGELRGDLAKLVELIVASAKKLPAEDLMAQDWNHFSKTWKPIHRHVGVNRIADYVTAEQFEKAIFFARHILVRLGVEPPTQLRLVG